MSFHKKFCNWASQKKININKVTYKRAENAFIDTLACILSGVKEKPVSYTHLTLPTTPYV